MIRTLVSRSWPFLVVSILLSLAPSVARYLQGYYTPEGLLSDIFSGLIVASICVYANRMIKLPLLIIWAAAEIGSFILLGTMARLPSWTDLHFLADTSFLSNSSEQVETDQLMTILAVAIPALIVFLLPKRKISECHRPTTVTLALLTATMIGASLFAQKAMIDSDKTSDNLYAQYSPVHWLGAEAFKILSTNSQPIPADYMYAQDLNGTSLLPDERKGKNVLIIAMEGMSGIYLKQARESIVFDGDKPPILLSKLSDFAKQGMVTPDYIVHTHQTIRGLYSILCGDFDKLTVGAPKAVEIQNSPERAARCLPSVLRDNGYSTHFLQGAGLAFMGKDRVMPFIGFDQAHGNEWFTKRRHVKFGWGVDDKTFFEGALSYIDGLQRDSRREPNKPWMLTMLTVGTHQPYAVPDKLVAQYDSRRDASVAYLDDAVSSFLQSLKRRGVLKNTLVIVTSDESHGSEIADWVSSWGLNVILSPEADKLPKVNDGKFAAFDTSTSVLDYLNIAQPNIAGRSLFRRYDNAREMVSNTSGRLRWLKTDGTRLECSPMGGCRPCKATSLIGTAECGETTDKPFNELTRKAYWLDNSVVREGHSTNTLNFADGTIYNIKKPWENAWTDNLIGAQYLDFPAGSKTTVTMKWKVLKAGEEGGGLKLQIKQSEQEVKDITTEIPVLHTGDDGEYKFTFLNPDRRYNFSFHLLPDSPMDVQILKFTVQTSK